MVNDIPTKRHSRLRQFSIAWRGLQRSTRWLIAAAILVAISSFSVRLIESPQYSALRGYDNSFNYFWIRSLIIDGDWDFRNDVIECNTLTEPYRQGELDRPPTTTGRHANKYGTGWAVASAPFFLAADTTVRLAHVCGLHSIKRDGFGPVYQFWIQFGQFALGIGSLILAYRIVRHWADRESALLGMLGVWAAGPLTYYQTNNLSMSHNVAFAAIVLTLYSLLRAEQTPAVIRWWVLAGAGVGLAAITRFQLAIWGILPLVAVWRQRHSLPIAWRATAWIAAGAIPFIALQLYAWHYVYGSWVVFSYGENGEGFFWASPQIINVLFSSFHGLYYCHPFLLIASGALIVCARHIAGWPRAGLLVLLITIYVNAAWWCWWMGASFGNRGFEACMIFLMIGCAWCIAHWPKQRKIWVLIISIGFAANVILLILFASSAIPRNEPVTYNDMLRALTGN